MTLVIELKNVAHQVTIMTSVATQGTSKYSLEILESLGRPTLIQCRGKINLHLTPDMNQSEWNKGKKYLLNHKHQDSNITKYPV